MISFTLILLLLDEMLVPTVALWMSCSEDGSLAAIIIPFVSFLGSPLCHHCHVLLLNIPFICLMNCPCVVFLGRLLFFVLYIFPCILQGLCLVYRAFFPFAL